MNIKSKYVIAALCGIVVILLIIIAFLLGRTSVKNGNNPHESSDSAEVIFSEDNSYNSNEDQSSSNIEIKNEPKNLDLAIPSGSVSFVTGDKFSVRYDSSVIKVTSSGDTMEIRSIYKHPTDAQRRRMNITVTLPADYSFSDVNLNFGAGKLVADSFSCSTLALNLGAGSATFDNISVASSADINEGAGELVIYSGSIRNLTLRCGAGSAKVCAALIGSSSIEAGVGEVDIDLKGTEADYKVSFRVGIGTCYYNNGALSNSGTYGTGENTVQIRGGLGMVKVDVAD